MSVLINLSIFPTDKGISASPYVARVIKMLEDSGWPFALNSMSTNIETAEMSDALELIQKAYDVLSADCDRVYAVVTMDIKKGEIGRIKAKVESVNSKLR